MTTFIVRFDPPDGAGPSVAVKDMLDVAGVPTTCGAEIGRAHV